MTKYIFRKAKCILYDQAYFVWNMFYMNLQKNIQSALFETFALKYLFQHVLELKVHI